MFIRIDDLKPLANGELWILASYYEHEGGTRLSREQCHRFIQFAELRQRQVAGKLLCLDGRQIAPEDVTAADAQIGFEVEHVAVDPVPQVKQACEAFLPALAKAQAILSEFAKKSAADLVTIARGRKKYCEQLFAWAAAARLPMLAAKYLADLQTADSAGKDAKLLKKAADEEVAIYVKTLAEEPDTPLPQFTVDPADPRGLLTVPDIAAMVGMGWEV